jgi:glycosyltransferase involved in cell wall biosynthesis
MNVCFLGGYDPRYPRHQVIRKGLAANGVQVAECQVAPGFKFWQRYPLLIARYFRTRAAVPGTKSLLPNMFFVPEFCQKDVPLARFLSFFSSRKIVFDPLASRFETKILDWRRNPVGSPAAWWNIRIDAWAFKFSDLILADTSAHGDYYCQNYRVPREKVAVLPVGYDDSLFDPSAMPGTKEKHGRFVVLFFGSFLPLHGADVVVRAASIALRKDPSLHFRFIGSGQTLPGIKNLAAELGLAELEFKGWAAERDLVREIASADICLGIFGRTEKAGRVVPHKVFQAMGMRKPVITAQTPAIREFFSHRENIYLCSSPDPESLAGSILELKREAALRERIAENGHALVKAKFSAVAIGRSLKEILEKKFL